MAAMRACGRKTENRKRRRKGERRRREERNSLGEQTAGAGSEGGRAAAIDQSSHFAQQTRAELNCKRGLCISYNALTSRVVSGRLL